MKVTPREQIRTAIEKIKSEARLRIGGGEASLVKVLIAKRAAMMDPRSILFDFARMEGED